MALEISGNKENPSLSWETFVLFNTVNDERKTRQEPLILYFAFRLRSSNSASAVISKLLSAEYVVMIFQRYWIALNAVYFSKTLCICCKQWIFETQDL